METIDRRAFLLMTSAGATSLAVNNAVEAASTEDSGLPVVRMHGDGLGLSPAQYADRLARLAAAGSLEPDAYSQGGAVEALEHEIAGLLGKERAVFLPTGTLANQLAVRRLAGNHGRVLVQSESHLYNDSGDCLPQLSRLQAIGLSPGEATFSVDQVQREIERADSSKVRTPVRAISIESPVRRLWGRVFDFEEMKRVSAFARAKGIGLHMDGARVFLAAPYSGVSVAEYADLFDTVYVSLWKYFNAGSGAILAGPAAVLDDLFHDRRMFGGSLPRAWVYAGVAKHYLRGFSDRFADAVRRSQEVFRLLEGNPAVEIQRPDDGTNVVRLTTPGVEPHRLRLRLREAFIDLPGPLADGSGFKVQVNETWRAQPPRRVAEIIMQAAS